MALAEDVALDVAVEDDEDELLDVALNVGTLVTVAVADAEPVAVAVAVDVALDVAVDDVDDVLLDVALDVEVLLDVALALDVAVDDADAVLVSDPKLAVARCVPSME